MADSPEQTIIKLEQAKPGRLNTAIKAVALAALVGVGAGMYQKVNDFSVPGGPNIPKLDGVKDAADKTMAAISSREVKPLQINPKDVVLGKISGMEQFGHAERPVTVAYAEKKYDSRVPGADEFVRLRDAEFMLEAGVRGGATVKMDQDTRTVSVILNAPTTNQGLRVLQPAQIDMDPGIVASGGQLFGNDTKPNPAVGELHTYVTDLQNKDTKLYDTAACMGVKTAGDLTRTVLELAGFTVDMDDASVPEAVAYLNADAYVNTIRLDVAAWGRPDPTFIGPKPPEYTWEACQPIINQATSDQNGQASSQLPGQWVANVNLPGGKK